jgi:DNA polymerase-3 subunit chi
LLRVDFAFGAHDRIAQAVRTTQRHVNKGTPLMVFCDDEQRLERYDYQLWALEDTAFVAHERLTPHALEGLKVYLVDTESWPLLPAKLATVPYQSAWLLNLADQLPPEPQALSRILEVVGPEDDDREKARMRWRQYQRLGADLHSHRLT